jgi:hypothetical protein
MKRVKEGENERKNEGKKEMNEWRKEGNEWRKERMKERMKWMKERRKWMKEWMNDGLKDVIIYCNSILSWKIFSRFSILAF